MKKTIALMLALLLALCSAAAVSADTFVTLNGFSFYANSDGEAVIVGYDDSSADVEIPESLMGAKVTQIANNAFFGHSSIEQLSFVKATGLSTIGSNAFCGCSAITSVSIPALDELGFGAFQGCTALTSLTIAEGLKSIPAQAFYGCEKLEAATLPATVTTIGDYAFGNCTSLGRTEIPATVTTICDTAFYNCEQLVILCDEDSAAHRYALAHEIPYELVFEKTDIAAGTAATETQTVRFNGQAQCPAVTVSCGDTLLKENVDYTLAYSDNTEVGKATIHIIGCGAFKGDLYTEFLIKNVLGDTDGDGIVSVLDATAIQRRLADLPVADPQRVDLVGSIMNSGELTIMDATCIQRWLAEFETPYPIDSLID